MSQSFSLYIHIPFCAAKCAYCDFASWPGQERLWVDYLQSLIGEMSAWKGSGHLSGRRIATLFIGGGTPSILPGRMIEDIMAAVRSLALFEDCAEITIEANPGTLTEEKLDSWKKAGINRISFGAQSFDDDLLKKLSRIHTADEIRAAVVMARAAGFKNINLDLMYALPGQDMEKWVNTIEAALALNVPHISAYSLIVETGTPMAKWVDSGNVSLPDEDQVNAMQRYAVDRLEQAGLFRYEISNYARPGHESRHNLTYWQRGDYLGIGCAAHSMINECRFANASALNEYLDMQRTDSDGDLQQFLLCNGYRDIEPLSREDRMEETLMLSTRTVRGLDLAAWQRDFGEDFIKPRADIVRSLVDAGLVCIENGRLALTTQGMEVQNAVVIALLE